jgi:WD40 repeat protein
MKRGRLQGWASLALVWSLSYGVYAQNTLEVEWRLYPNYSAAPAFSPDGNWLATAQAGTVYIRRVGDWQPLRSLTVSPHLIRGMSFHPSGRYLAVVDVERTTHVVDTQTWQVVSTFTFPTGHTFDVAFDQSGRRIAVLGYFVRVWDFQTGQLLFESPSVSGFLFAFSPDGRYVAARSDSPSAVVIYDVDAQQVAATISPQYFSQLDAIAFSPNGQWLAFTDRNATYLVRTDTWRVVRTAIDVEQTSGYKALAFSPDSQFLYGAGGTASRNNTTVYPFRILEVANLRIVGTAYSGYSTVNKIAVSPDGVYAALGRAVPLEVVHIPTRTASVPVEYIDTAYDLAIAPSGAWYATADSLRWMTRRDAATGQRVYRSPDGFHINTPNAIAISPDEQWIATGGSDNRIVVWNAASGAWVRTLTGHLGALRRVAFLDNTTLLSVSADGTLRRWDIASGQQLQSRAIGQQIHAADVSADRQWVAVAGQDRRVRLFRAADLQPVAQTDPLPEIANRVVLSRTGQHLALSLPGGRYRVYQPFSMQLRFESQFPSGHTSPLALAFSQDERALVIGGYRSNRLAIVSAYTGQERFATTEETTSGVARIAFTPDNRSFILVRYDTAQIRVRYPLYRLSGDVDGNGCVDDADLLGVLFAFGQQGADLAADLNGDALVDDADLLQVLFAFGEGC